MVDRSWATAVNGSWSSSTRWSPTGIPTSNDNCSIDYNVTVSVASLSNCRDLTIWGNVTFSCSSTLTINGSLYNNNVIRQIGSGRLAMGGSLNPVEINPGDNNFTNFAVSKSSRTANVYLNGQLNCRQTTASRFFHTGGTFHTNYNEIHCNSYDQSSGTGRDVYMTSDIYVYGTGGSATNTFTFGNTTAVDYLQTDGLIRIVPSGTGTATCAFGADRLSGPAVYLGNVGTPRNFAVTGHVRSCELNGQFVSTTNISLWGDLTGTPTATSMITGVTINQFAEANQELFWNYNTVFGTIGFSTTFSGVTFNLDNARASTINCNSANTIYNINNIDANGVGGFNACNLNCNGSGSNYYYNYFRDTTTTGIITMGGSSTTNHYVNDINTVGAIIFNIGNLELNSWPYCRNFVSTSASTRNFQFNYNWIVVNGNHRSGTNGNGSIQISGTTSLLSDSETDDGGFILQGTGSSQIGTWSAINSVRLIIESVSGTLSPVVSGGQIRNVELRNSISFTSATVLSIIREGFGWNGVGSLNLTNLTIDYIHPTGQSLDYRPSNALSDANYRIGTFRITSTAGDNQSWNINVYCRNLTLSEPTGTFYLDDIDFTGQISCSGSNAIYNYGSVINNQGTNTAEQILMSGSSTTVHNITWYNVNVNGIINHSIGKLHLDFDLNCRVFRSTSGSTRIWEFNNNWINTSGTGYFDCSGTTSITSDSEINGGGFRVKGSGTNSFGSAAGNQAPRVIFDPQGGTLSTAVSSGNVREVYLEPGTINFTSSTITFVKYGMTHGGGSYNTLSLTCNINFVDNETFNYTYTRIGTLAVTGAPTGKEYYLNADCNTINITSGSNTYNLDNITHGATVTMSGGSATYNLNYLRSSVANASCSLTGASSTYNFGNWQHTGTITHSNGTANISSVNNEFGTWTSISSSTRRFQGNGYFVRILSSLNFSSGVASFTSDSNGGFEMRGNSSSANLTGVATSNSNAFDLRIFANITFSSNGVVNNLIFGESCGIQAAAVINVRGSVDQITPYTASNSLANLTINMLLNGTYNADTPAPVGTVSGSVTGQSITVNNMYASTVTFSGQTSSYTINNATSITTLNCQGNGSTYSILSMSGTTINLNSSATAGTPTFNLGSINVVGTSVGQGIQFIGLGNLNLVGNPTISRFNSNTSLSRSINFGIYFFIVNSNGNININQTSGFSSTENGGGWKLDTGSVMDIGATGSGASMNVQFKGILNLTTPGSSFIKNLQNYWDEDTATPGYISSSNFTLTVYGGVKLAGDGTSSYGNWPTTNISVINNDTTKTPDFTTYPSGSNGYVTIPILEISGSGVTRDLVGNLYVGTFIFNSGGFNLNNNTISATTCTLTITAKSIDSGTSGKIQTTDWFHSNISLMTWTGTGYVEVYSGSLNNGGAAGATTNVTNFRIAGNPTVNNNFYANNLTLVGWTPNSSLYRTYITGNLTYSGGMDSTSDLHTFEFIGTNAASVSTTVAMTNSFPRFIISGGKTLTIQNPILASIIEISASNTLNTNDQAITVDNRIINNGTVTLGSSIITISANGNIWSGSASQIINGGTSEIKFTGAGSFDRTVYFGTGNTLNKLTNATTFSHSGSGDGTGWLTIQSDNLSIALVAKDPGAYSSGFKFTNQGGGVAKVTSFSIDGISGFPTYVQGPITKPGSVGTMTFNWLGVKNSVVSGGAPPGWYANSSVDYGGNTGWIFAAPINTNNGNGFFVFF